MPKQAPRVSNAIWEEHKEEIIATLVAPGSTLEATIQHMKGRGFGATQSQYIAQLRDWGVEKNATASDWETAVSKKRTRDLVGKESDFFKHGKRIRKESSEKEVARHSSLVNAYRERDDEFEPRASIRICNTTSVQESLFKRVIYVDDLPFVCLQMELNTVFKNRDLSPKQRDIFVQIEEVFEPFLRSDCASVQGRSKSRLGKDALDTWFRPHCFDSDGDAYPLTSKGSTSAEKHSSVSRILASFILLCTNALVPFHEVKKGLEWLLKHSWMLDWVVSLARRGPTGRILINQLFLTAVRFGDRAMASHLVASGVDVNAEVGLGDDIGVYQHSALEIAVGLQDAGMVELLCELGANLTVQHDDKACLSTRDGAGILRLLLSAGADPDRFIRNQAAGFPLISAAAGGNHQTVEMLLEAGASVTAFVPELGGTAIQVAASSGRTDTALLLLHAGADINSPLGAVQGVSGRLYKIAFLTPLALAVKEGHHEMVKLLLQHGASANACILPDVGTPSFLLSSIDFSDGQSPYARDSFNWLPLQYAAENGSCEIAFSLISAGAGLNHRPRLKDSHTPLQIAAKKGHFGICCLLLGSGADINFPPASEHGRTALQGAAASGNLDLCRFLLVEKADVNALPCGTAGLTALQAALSEGHIDVARLLLQSGADLYAAASPVLGRTATQAAFLHGDISIIQKLMLLEGNLYESPSGCNGITALLAATIRQNIKLVELVLKYSPDVNTVNISSCIGTPLQVGVSQEWWEGVDLLLNKGAEVNSPAPQGEEGEHMCALGWAIYQNKPAAVDLLLKHGADPNMAAWGSPDAPSVLLYALDCGASVEVIEPLIDAGGDLGSLWDGSSALELTAQGGDGYIKITKRILDGMKTLPKDLFRMHASKALHVLASAELCDGTGYMQLEALLSAGANIDASDPSSHTVPLQETLHGFHTYLARWLLEKGAKVDAHASDAVGTPLQEAIKYKHMEIVDIILEQNPDINAPPAKERGATALQAAAIHGMTGLAKDLLERGADIMSPAAPIDGRTALEAAAEHGRPEMLQLLLNAHGGGDGLHEACGSAAQFAEKECHYEIASWLQRYCFSHGPFLSS
ncbi:ankyrin repeat-containing domain protein [Aspergillus varians]